MSLESYIIDLIENHRPSYGVKAILSVCSLAFRCVIALRNFFYDKNWLKTHKVSIPVVSIGNIVAGGTGKTPFVSLLTKELCSSMQDVAILTRGFKSQIEKKGTSEWISSGAGPRVSPQECGDEAFWLATETQASIWVGKDRVQSAQMAVEQKAKLLLLEDGFQHRRLARDIEIVLLDAKDLFGHGYFLPRGYLRDSPKRLAKADWIILNHLSEEMLIPPLEEKIRQFSQAPIIGMRPQYELDPEWKGKKVGVFCGIAKPHRFYQAVESQTEIVAQPLFSADHIVPSLPELQAYAEACKKKGAEALICTEKDRVKIENSTLVGLPIVPLKMKLICVYHQNLWIEMLEKIKTII